MIHELLKQLGIKKNTQEITNFSVIKDNFQNFKENFQENQTEEPKTIEVCQINTNSNFYLQAINLKEELESGNNEILK